LLMFDASMFQDVAELSATSEHRAFVAFRKCARLHCPLPRPSPVTLTFAGPNLAHPKRAAGEVVRA
jgi:hypothetical protein